MIKLTIDSNGKSLYINPDLVQSILPVENSTRVTVAHDVLFVTESPEEVTRKILEYKLAVARYSMTYAIAVGRGDKMSPDYESTETEWELRNLAGLEEEPK